MSDALAEKGLKLFEECLIMIKDKDFNCLVREKLMLTSTIAGMVIAQLVHLLHLRWVILLHTFIIYHMAKQMKYF